MADVVYWKGDNLYLNITNRCSNNCYFCFRNFIDGVWGFDLKLSEEPRTSEVIKNLQRVINKKSWNEIVFCGFGEPTERIDCLLEVTQWIKKHHKNPVRVDTNGQAFLLNPRRNIIDALKKVGLDGVSVSVNAHNKEIYDRVCKPKFENAFESVLDFIEKARLELDTEITTVTIPEVDIKKVEEMAERIGVRFRMRKYEPPFFY